MRVAIVGGGLQGVGSALELAMRGASVVIFEKRDQCLTQASLQNEGKIHLGFLYAKDRAGLASARLMVEGAYRFGPIVRRWLELDLRRSLSEPFVYAVHRESLVSPDQAAAHYDAVSTLARHLARQPGLDYFGVDATVPVRRLSARECEAAFDPDLVSAAFRTPEIAIDPEVLAEALAARLAQDSHIEIHTSCRVVTATPEANGVDVTFERGGAITTERFDHVVNASWEDRLAVDHSAGIAPTPPWCFRMKYFLRFRRANGAAPRTSVPSVTIVLGPFGDTVRYANGDHFFSWYPVGRRGPAIDLTPPPWPLPLADGDAAALRQNTMAALGAIIPGLRTVSEQEIRASEVKGGIIFAAGDSDVDDPSSALHERHRVGPRSFGRFHSIDTGRYTLAPMFAEQIGRLITGEA